MRQPAALLLLALAAGCDRGPAPAPTPAPPPRGESVENPEYANWSRFPVGTAVTRRSVARRGEAETVTVETTRLAAADAAGVTLVREGRTTRSDGSLDRANPPDTRAVPKSFALPGGMSAEDFVKPNVRARLDRAEDIEVAGKTYKTSVYRWDDGTEAGPMAVAVWWCPDLPGRVAKQTMTVAKTGTTTTDLVESVSVPGKKSPQVPPPVGR